MGADVERATDLHGVEDIAIDGEAELAVVELRRMLDDGRYDIVLELAGMDVKEGSAVTVIVCVCCGLYGGIVMTGAIVVVAVSVVMAAGTDDCDGSELPSTLTTAKRDRPSEWLKGNALALLSRWTMLKQ